MPRSSTPWYRQPLVWLVVGIPAASVVFGIAMLIVSIRTFDAPVVDDYYKRGKEINRQHARDARAAALGIAGDLAAENRVLRVRLTAADMDALPRSAQITLWHSTRSEHDHVLIVPAIGGGQYETPLPELIPGVWNVELATADWRITGRWQPASDAAIELKPFAGG
ncbi:MAG: FixH family protein [Chromatiales bacterium]|nr:FixH family protein [Chromatiales bacterium]